MGGFINWKRFWNRYFLNTPLLVIIHISHTQKWARGFTEPSRYNAVANVYNWKTSRRGDICRCYFLVRYFIYAALLVIIYILYTQKWAAQRSAPLRSGKLTMMVNILNNKRFIHWWYLNVKINYCNCYIVVWDYVVCSVACTVDVYDLFLLFVEISSDVFV